MLLSLNNVDQQIVVFKICASGLSTFDQSERKIVVCARIGFEPIRRLIRRNDIYGPERPESKPPVANLDGRSVGEYADRTPGVHSGFFFFWGPYIQIVLLFLIHRYNYSYQNFVIKIINVLKLNYRPMYKLIWKKFCEGFGPTS